MTDTGQGIPEAPPVPPGGAAPVTFTADDIALALRVLATMPVATQQEPEVRELIGRARLVFTGARGARIVR